MQAIIMAAGKGSRLGELTGGNPKSFVKVHGKSLIEYNLGILKDLGIFRITIVTGYREEAFEELVAGMQGVTLVYNPFYPLVNVLGSFYMGMEELYDNFIYLHADTICEPKVFERLCRLEADINLPVEYKRCDEEAMKVLTESGKVVRLSKKIDLDRAEGEFIGIASFRKDTIPYLKQAARLLLKNGEFHEYFEAAIQELLNAGDFSSSTVPMNGIFWQEIDFREDLERAARLMPEYMYKGI